MKRPPWISACFQSCYVTGQVLFSPTFEPLIISANFHDWDKHLPITWVDWKTGILTMCDFHELGEISSFGLMITDVNIWLLRELTLSHLVQQASEQAGLRLSAPSVFLFFFQYGRCAVHPKNSFVYTRLSSATTFSVDPTCIAKRHLTIFCIMIFFLCWKTSIVRKSGLAVINTLQKNKLSKKLCNITLP